MDNLRVLLVGDMQGDDDEGMKKITRNLSDVLQKKKGIESRAVSIHEAIDEVKSIDILHYVGGPTYKSVLFAAWCKRKSKKLKTILSFTNPIWGFVADTAIRLLTPDYVIVSSNYWKQWADRLNIKNSLLPLSGVDLYRFCPVSSERKNQLRRKLDLPFDKILVLHVGHLKDDRNLKELLRVQLHTDLQVIIIGSTTTQQTAQLVNYLERSNCIVIKKYQPKIEEFYQAVDCYVFPTIDPEASVQIPLSVLEAMATNLPVITTQFGGLPTFFPTALGLYYIYPDQFVDLSKMIKPATEAPSATCSLVQEFSWESIANRLCKIYFECLRK